MNLDQRVSDQAGEKDFGRRIGKALREARLQRNHSLRSACKAFGLEMSASGLHYLETRGPSMETIRVLRLAKDYDLDFYHLLSSGDESSSFPKSNFPMSVKTLSRDEVFIELCNILCSLRPESRARMILAFMHFLSYFKRKPHREKESR